VDPRSGDLRRPATIRLLLSGDVMLGRGIDQVMAHPVDPRLQEPSVRDARDYVRLAERASGPIPAPVPPAWPWGEALAAMERLRPDLRVINLETAVTAGGRPWPGKGVHYRMHPDHLESLRVAGIDACVLANNHVLDWGAAGLHDTLAALKSSGIGAVGAGADRRAAQRPLALPLPGGGRLLVSAWAHPSSGVPRQWGASEHWGGVALLPELDERGLRRIEAALTPQRGSGDLTLVALHWGGNWVEEIPAEHRRFARALIERGLADVVHGHSSHHPLPVEVHGGTAILYGCGDLINDYEGIAEPLGRPPALRSDVVCLYLLELRRAGGELERLEVVPFRLRRFRLSPRNRATGRRCSGCWACRPRAGDAAVAPQTARGCRRDGSGRPAGEPGGSPPQRHNLSDTHAAGLDGAGDLNFGETFGESDGRERLCRLLQLLGQQIVCQQQQRHAHQRQGGAALFLAAQLEGASSLQVLRPAELHGQPPIQQLIFSPIPAARERIHNTKH
jgi:poly-gamma-glutamate synthesis protein (capsule biosynthesis protein)